MTPTAEVGAKHHSITLGETHSFNKLRGRWLNIFEI